MGSFSHTLTGGLYHLFVLGWNGSSFIMTIYTGATASSSPTALRNGTLQNEGGTDIWRQVDELLLAIPEMSDTPPKGILKSTN